VTRLGRSTLLLNSKAPKQMTAECWRWRPRWNWLASSTSCFGSSACLQSSSSVLCKTAYGLESPQDRLGGTHAEGAAHPDKLTGHGWRWYYAGGTDNMITLINTLRIMSAHVSVICQCSLNQSAVCKYRYNLKSVPYIKTSYILSLYPAFY